MGMEMENETRTKVIIIRFTPTEKNRILDQAKKRGMKFTELIRAALDRFLS